MNYTDKGSFQTRDTALAAYLRSEGFFLEDIDVSNHPALFVFPNDSSLLQKYIIKYQAGSAVGNIANFFRLYKATLAEMKDAQREREASRRDPGLRRNTERP